MSDADRLKLVIERTVAHLDKTRIESGPRTAMIDAGAIVEGSRQFLIKHYGRRATYSLFAELSDGIITPELAEGR